VAYGGYPRALHSLALVAETRAGEPVTGSLDTEGVRAERGRAVWEAIYADQSPAVLAGLERLIPGLSRCVVEDAYGRILARPGLTLAERELLAVAALALMALPRPLGSHIRGALRNGSPAASVEDILRSSRPWASSDASEVVDEALDRLSRKVYER
jgi:4-carboxymuconolactone decarboxylase